MKTTSIKLDDGWCVNRHTGTFDDSVEWYSLDHLHDNDRGIEVGWDDERGYHDVSDVFENCPSCGKVVPDKVIGFLRLCKWEVS